MRALTSHMYRIWVLCRRILSQNPVSRCTRSPGKALLTQFPLSTDYTRYSLRSGHGILSLSVRRGIRIGILRTAGSFPGAVYLLAAGEVIEKVFARRFKV